MNFFAKHRALTQIPVFDRWLKEFQPPYLFGSFSIKTLSSVLLFPRVNCLFSFLRCFSFSSVIRFNILPSHRFFRADQSLLFSHRLPYLQGKIGYSLNSFHYIFHHWKSVNLFTVQFHHKVAMYKNPFFQSTLLQFESTFVDLYKPPSKQISFLDA